MQAGTRWRPRATPRARCALSLFAWVVTIVAINVVSLLAIVALCLASEWLARRRESIDDLCEPLLRCYKPGCEEPAAVLSVNPARRCLGHACAGGMLHFIREVRVPDDQWGGDRLEVLEFHDEQAELPIPHGCSLPLPVRNDPAMAMGAKKSTVLQFAERGLQKAKANTEFMARSAARKPRTGLMGTIFEPSAALGPMPIGEWRPTIRADAELPAPWETRA